MTRHPNAPRLRVLFPHSPHIDRRKIAAIPAAQFGVEVEDEVLVSQAQEL